MSKIIKQDSNGVKPLLAVGEFGYDNYPEGGDIGRVYVGNGSENIPQAKKAEVVTVDGKVDTHVARIDNPHSVTKAQVGLGSVDNTSDANKPISTYTQNALDLKQNVLVSGSNIKTIEGQSIVGSGNIDLTKTDVGLSNVDNTADSAKVVASAGKWTTARTLSLTGGITGSVSIDGSGNASIVTTVAANSVALGTDTTGNYVAGTTAGAGVTVSGTPGEGWSPTIALTDVGTVGTYTKVTTNSKGQITVGGTLVAEDIPNLDTSKITTGTLPVDRGGTGVTTVTGTGSVVLNTSPALVTPNIGIAIGTSFNSITGLASVNPIIAGTASVGTSTLAARQDHVHPVQTTISGNAGTATKLATARTINGVSFDGSANITVVDSTKAPLASPIFTGTPIAPTAAADTSTTQLATTAFAIPRVTGVDNAIVRFDGTTGKVQTSNVTIDDNGNIGIGGVTTTNDLIVGNLGGTNGHISLRRASDGIQVGSLTVDVTNSKIDLQSGYGTLSLSTGSTERMRIDSAGNVLIRQTGGTSHAISGNNYDTGLPIIQFGGDGTTNAVAIFAINNSAWTASNAAATAIRVGDSTTGRSISTAGTINASGADYAEYEYSNDITIAKGQIVGFKADGTLTDKYAEAVRFAIKSTNPSIVGGDVWGAEDVVGKRPEQPVRKLDKTEQVQVEESEEFETVVIEVGDTDAEWEAIEAKYKAELADFEAILEAERQKVDRIAYAGKVPVNVYGATAGQYIVAIEKDGGIDGLAVNKADMTFAQYQDTVGRVNKILDDGRAEVAVIIH